MRNGDLFADQLLLKGQTLYVAAGQGDLQLFDVSPWLDFRFNTGIELQHYFSLLGAVNGFAFSADAIYAGSSFVYVDDEPTENPIEPGARIQDLGGSVNTIINDELVIIEQLPQTNAYLPADTAVELQFNKIIDPELVRDNADSLMQVTLSGEIVSGFVSAQINNSGTRLLFRPAQPFEPNREYRVTLFGNIETIHGDRLNDDYSFRFTASGHRAPEIDEIAPVFGRWSGAYTLTIRGEQLEDVARVEIADQVVEAAEFVSHHANQITIAAPGLSIAPTENRVVGLRLDTGELSDFRAAAFTYVADPEILQIGSYDAESGEFSYGDQRFAYNQSEMIGMRGNGLTESTRVYVNDAPSGSVELIDRDKLVFAVPDNVLGPLTISLSNHPDGVDRIDNTELNVLLRAELQLSSQDAIARHGHLLLTQRRSGNDPLQISLYSTRDSAIPVLLSSFTLEENITDIALTDQYFVLVSEDRRELLVYDIGNLYAPTLVNRILNPAGVEHGQLQLYKQAFVSRSGSTLNVGYLRGNGWREYDFGASVEDMTISDGFIYLLQSDRIEVRSLLSPELEIVANYFHTLARPETMLTDSQRLLIVGRDRIELAHAAYLDDGLNNDFLGSAMRPKHLVGSSLRGVELLALNGELLISGDYQSHDGISLWELSFDREFSTSLQLSHLVNIDQSGSAASVIFERNLAEWMAGANYFSVAVPLVNVYDIEPGLRLGGEVQTINLSIVGDPEEWDSVIVDVREDGSERLLSGDSRLLGSQLGFTPFGDRYRIGERYRIDLFNQPAPAIDFGTEVDMPWRLETPPLFGFEEFSVVQVTPSTTITDRPTSFTVQGHALDQVTEISLNGLSIPSSDWTLNADGTEISFDAQIAAAGTYSLLVGQQAQQEVLPAALLVQQALGVSAISTDNPSGADRLSDSPGDIVSLEGLGFAGTLRVHLYPADAGFEPAASNRMDYYLSGSQLRFRAPPAQPGTQYQVVLIRDETDERVDVAARLAGIDDTRPLINQVTPLATLTPVSIVANEDIVAGGFSVVEEFRDYSGDADVDISDRFELVSLGNEILLRLKPGNQLQNNRKYHVAIDGIADVAGNLARNGRGVSGGRYSATFTSSDLLAPRNLELRRESDNQPVDLSMTLTRGRGYSFVASAEDNLSGSLTYEARVSTNDGLSFGAWQRMSNARLSRDILSSYDDLRIRVKVTDASGNFDQRDYDITVIDPIINVSDIFTDPIEVDELSRADIMFTLGGDADLIRSATLQVLDRNYPATIITTGSNERLIKLSYVHPRLSQIAPSDQITVTLNIVFGLPNDEQRRSYFDQYTLFLDKTPPTIEIVSPGDGDRIILGDPTDVLFKVFDRFAIDRVEVSIDGGDFIETRYPNRYSFTPLDLDPVTIQVRATDANGNQSVAGPITVQPYDASLGEPRVDILAPANGSSLREGEDLPLELEMQNVTEATLYFDVGGNAGDPRNPAPIELLRDPESASRFAYTAQVPLTGENIAMIARIESGTLKARRFFNIVRDDGIGETAFVASQPFDNALTGTEIQLSAARPPEMTDFDDGSEIQVTDPLGALDSVRFPYDGEAHAHRISTEGAELQLAAILRDRSGNEVQALRNVAKIPYFGDTRTPLLSLAEDEVFAGMQVVPGLSDPGDNLFVAINDRDGGYRIDAGGATQASDSDGEILQLQWSGALLLAEINRGGQRELRQWRLLDGALTEASPFALNGTLIAASGDTVFVQNGRSLFAYVLDGNLSLAVLGVAINETILHSAVESDRLLLLSESGLYVYRIDVDEAPKLQRLAFIALPDQSGFAVEGDRLFSWNDSELQLHQLIEINDENSIELALTLIEQTDLDVAVDGAARFDGELLWLPVHRGDAQGVQWRAYRYTELVGILPASHADIGFAGDRAYVYELDDSVNRIVRVGLIADEIGAAMAPQLSESAFGVIISDIDADNTLGGETVFFTDSSGRLLPVEPLWREANRHWFIKRGRLPAGAITAVRLNRAGTRDEAILLRNETTFSLAESLHPASAASLTQGASVAFSQLLDASARNSNSSLDIDSTEIAAPVANDRAAAVWITLPNDASLTYDHLLDGVVNSSNSVTLQVNEAELDSVTISKPQNNQSFIEGQELELRYRSSENTGEAYRYTQVRLLDFNRNLVQELRSGAADGSLTLRLPEVDQQTNFFVNVRSYYGDRYRYSEREVGIRVVPKISIPTIRLDDVNRRQMPGSQLSIGLDRDIPADLSASILVYDENDQLLEAGGSQVSLVVPETVQSLRVVASVEDDFGNRTGDERTIQIVDHFRLQPASGPIAFDALLPGVGTSYIAQGRRILDNQGQQLAEFNSAVTALAHVGDRVIIALEGIGLVVADPFNQLRAFRQLSNEPLGGFVSHLQVNNDRLIVIVDGAFKLYSIDGNAIEWIRDISVNGYAIDAINRGDRFVLLASGGLYQLEDDNSIESLLSMNGLSAMLELNDNLLVSTFDSGIWYLDAGDTAHRLDTELDAVRLLALDGDVLAITPDGEIKVLDARDLKSLETIGHFASLAAPNAPAAIAQGQLWIGGDSPARYDLLRQSGDPVLLYQDTQPRGLVESVALIDGLALGSADYYGLQLVEIDEGEYRRSFVPGPRAEPTHQVVEHRGIGYLRQDDSLLVKSLEVHNNNRSGNLLSNQSVGLITAAEDYLVASQLGDLVFKSYDGDLSGRVSVKVGDEIVSLISRGNTIYAAMQSGTLYRVRIGGLPLLEAETEISVLVAAGAAIRHMTTSGDYLVYALGSDLHRLSLDDLDDRVLTLASSVSALTTDKGRVFVAAGAQLQSVELEDWTLTANELSASAGIRSIAVEHNRLLLGLGGQGMALYELPLDWFGVNPALAMPHFAASYEQTDVLPLTLQNAGNANAVRFAINGDYAATQTRLPFDQRLRIPALLRNGQPFDIGTRIESVWGEIAESRKRKVLLQSLDEVVNDFDVLLAQSDIYLPLPLEMRATVVNSGQPMEQVEFYYSPNQEGPWEIIGKHFGPDYVVYRNFTIDQAGHYLKARAIDIYGNYNETEPVVLQRLSDDSAPTAEFALSGTVIGENPVGGHPFAVDIDLEDIGSGIDYALLERDGVLVSAAFGDADIRFEESLAVAGQEYNYTVTAVDFGGNQIELTQSYTAIPDMQPEVSSVARPASVREQQNGFKVEVAASDDLNISAIEVEWTGHVKRRTYNDQKTSRNESFRLDDLRSIRIGSDQVEQLAIRVTDSLDQVTESLIDITVVPDQVPNAGAINVDVPLSAFFGSPIRIEAGNLRNADDGDLLTVEVFELQDGEYKLLRRKGPTTDDTIQAAGRRNLTESDDTNYQVVVRVTDLLGQSAQTAPASIILTQRPNYLEYVTPFDSDVNPLFIEAGEIITMQTRVTDVANRPVPNQAVEWIFVNLESGERSPADTIADSGLDGIATLTQTVRLRTGNYRVLAKLADPFYDAIAPAIHVLQVLPGDPAQIVIDRIETVVAGTAFDIDLEVQDAGGNRVNVGRESEIRLTINEPRYQIGFAGNLDIDYFSDRVEVVASIGGGVESIEAVASTVVGTYQLLPSYPDAVLNTLYDDDGDDSTAPIPANSIDMQVINAPPADMRIEIVSVDNQQYGDSERIEIEETVTLQLRLIDAYGNTVETLFENGLPRDANYFASMNATGSARVNNEGPVAALDLVRGRAEFTLVDDVEETVELTLTGLQPAADGFNGAADLDVEFLPLRPYISAAEFAVALDDTQPPVEFTISEAYELEAGADWSVRLDDAAQLVDLDTDETRLIAQLSEDIELNRCYDYDSSTLELVSTVTGLEILPQTGQVCAPQAAIPAQATVFGLENASFDLEVTVAADIDVDDIGGGSALVEGVPQGFDWSLGRIQLPEITSRAGLPDGHEITVYLSGDYALTEAPIRVANGITLRVLQLEGDFDGDGLGNALEVSLGLRPDDVDSDGNGIFDGDEDYDTDGLSNLVEVDLGTQLDNSDSDGDGISDGDEVLVFGTEPLLTDSDGDGIDDIIEIGAATDPLDANDFDISPFVTALVMDPNPVTATFEDGVEPIQASLTATLQIDAEAYEVDVSESRFGAEILSQDSAVIEHLGDSLLQLNGPGDTTLAVSLGSASIDVPVSIEEMVENLPPIDYASIENEFAAIEFNRGAVTDAVIDGNLAYITQGYGGLLIADVGDPDNIVVLGGINTSGTDGDLYAEAVAIQGNYAYLGMSEALHVVDISDPAAPQFIASAPAYFFDSLRVYGDTVYAWDSSDTVQVFDVRSAYEPYRTGTYNHNGVYFFNIAVEGDAMYVPLFSGLMKLDLNSDLLEPETSLVFREDDVQSIFIDGDTAYLGTETEIVVVDLSNPESGNEVARYSGFRYPWVFAVDDGGLWISEGDDYDLSRIRFVDIGGFGPMTTLFDYRYFDFAYSAQQNSTHTFVVVDNTLLIIETEVPGIRQPLATYAFENVGFTGFDVDNGFAYLTDSTSFFSDSPYGLRIFDVNDESDIHLESAVPLSRHDLYEVRNGRAFMSYLYDELSIFDVSDPSAPVDLNVNYVFQDYVLDMAIMQDQYLLVSSEFDYFDISDISNPASLSFIGEIYPDEAFSIATWEDYALLAQGRRGLSLLDLSDPLAVSSPYYGAIFSSGFRAQFAALEENVAYAASVGELAIFGFEPPQQVEEEPEEEPVEEGPLLVVNGEIVAVAGGTSIDHHRFTLTETKDLTILIPSAAFDTYMYLFEVTGEGLTYVSGNDDYDGLLSGIEITLEPGTYDIAVGGYFLTLNDAFGAINTRSTRTGLYSLEVRPGIEDTSGGGEGTAPEAFTFLGELEFESEITSLQVAGDYAYLNTETDGIYVVDVSNPIDPYVSGRHNYKAFENYYLNRFVDVEGDRVYLLDPISGITVMDLTQDLVITDRTVYAGEGVRYRIAWSVDRISPQPQVKCAVISGSCEVSNIDYVNRTATVLWSPSDFDNDHGIVIGVGNHNSYTSIRNRVRGRGTGESPAPVEREIDRFHGVLADNFLYGSVQHFDLDIRESGTYRVEASASGFVPEVYLVRFGALGDRNESPSIAESGLFADDEYSLSIGQAPLESYDAGRFDNRNFSEGPSELGNGLYEIRVYRVYDGTPIDEEPEEDDEFAS